MQSDQTTGRRWWGETTVPEGEAAYWRIGPLNLWASHSRNEWSLASGREGDPMQDSLVCEIPSTRAWPETSESALRFGFRQTLDALLLEPVLADRPIVINPATPFSLPPGEELTLYISTSLWVRLQTGKPRVELVELPTHRPSDTWFGPSTLEGELCYAGKTSARHQLENVPIRHHRAISALRVRNRARTPLTVERLKLPLPNMSLFESVDGQLWTETVTWHREQDGEMAQLELGSRPPVRVTEARLLTGRRVEPAGGSLIRAFGGLIRKIW